MSSSRDLLAREAGSLVGRLRTWTAVRYAAQALPGHTRADVVHHLAAELAALSGAPVRLPRLDGDLVLADQLAVAADDLVRSAPGDDVAGAATAHLLLHRTHLLDEPVPPGLAVRLPPAACSWAPEPAGPG